ncbi:hypothetical protein QWY99_08595 [Flavobacterium branchiarum]|uniref:Uncharacterized protein n=1 Tax=Flavobacterium branchiarum TaxID=1114870 RepID=A0ABV5FQD9_9FLAO|nr:hypothetical protein [Flavobacterium branchiarum]MDN3673104.1 hypothetical protein [Flavobacterium branchiarum]
MKTEDFILKRKALLIKKENQLKIINKDYNEILKLFVKENSLVEKFKVYELVKNGTKRRGFNRIVIYDIEVEVWDKDAVIIRIGGWWLNNENVPTKWDTMTVVGVSNPAIFKLSENQLAEKHPESNDKN